MRVNPEQIESMELERDFDFEAMLNESQKDFEGGSIQEGVIVRVDDEYAMIAVSGAKQEGRLNISELKDESGNLLFKKDDKIEVYVTQNNERLSISHKKVLKMRKLKEKIAELENAFEGKVVEAKIVKKNRGGYVVEFDGIEAFLPKKESALREDGKSIGRTFKMNIIGVDSQNQSIVLSRKQYLDTNEKVSEEVIQKLLSEDKVYQGSVKKITSFGMFVEVQGVEGLVHYTEISHKGPVNPAVLYKVGDSVEVRILGYDKDKKRLSFSVKAGIEDPWKEMRDQVDLGDTIRVNVSKIEPYGAFVDLGNGTEGFLHISEISWNKQIKHPSEVVSVGQELDVEIIEIDSEKKRLRVSLKKLAPKPFVQFLKQFKVGDICKGNVVKIVDFGAFVNLGEVDGLLHNEDLAWDRTQKASEKLKVGDSLEVKIIRIDESNEKISLSLKAMEESPVDHFSKKYGVDSIVMAKVLDIKDFGVFVTLEGGVEALIRDEDLSPMKKEELEVGQELEVAIVHIDSQNAKIRASIRRLNRIKEREQLNSYNSDTKMTLGDLIKQK